MTPTTAPGTSTFARRTDPRGVLLVTFTPYLPLPTQVWHFDSLMAAIEFLSDQGMSLAAAQELIATGRLESTQPGADGPDMWRFAAPVGPDPDELDGTDYDAIAQGAQIDAAVEATGHLPGHYDADGAQSDDFPVYASMEELFDAIDAETDAEQEESGDPRPVPVTAGAQRTAAISARVVTVASVLLALMAQVAIFTGHPLTGHLHTAALLDTAWLGLCCLGRALDYLPPEGGEPS